MVFHPALIALLGSLFAQAAPSPVGTVPAIVTIAWLQQHLNDSNVRVISTGDKGVYDRAHIPGARYISHDDAMVMGANQGLPAPALLASALANAGAVDNTHIVLYGDSPATTGWLFMAFASIGHGADVSMLEAGIDAWIAEGHSASTTAPPPANGTLTVRSTGDVVVDAAWVKARLESPTVRVLDVRTTGEWNAGHLPGAKLVLWQDLFADLKMQKLKPIDEIRKVFAAADVQSGQEVVTYCAIGMRASLMYWAARAAGVPARVYVGSFTDWQSNSTNPIVK
jgi:thiosulfate/3-mercaptopyruvate sulfurtransferase